MADWRDTVSGIVGGCTCATAGSPFDVVKVRLQSSSAYSGLFSTMRTIAIEEGPLALYRGLLPAMTSAVVENMVGITVQRTLRRQLALLRGEDEDVRYSAFMEVTLGGITGIFTGISICPAEVLKVRQQAALQQKGVKPDLLSVGSKLIREEGPRGLFRGLGALLCRDVPFNALFYGSYETFCTLAMKAEGLESKDDLKQSRIFVAGGFAGAFGWSVILPFDVAKTRLQAGNVNGSLSQVW